MRGHREREARIHPARIMLDRGVQKRPDLGEFDDGVELAMNLAAAHSEDRAIEIDVVPAAEFGMKAAADLEQRSDASVDRRASARRRRDPREDLQERALAGAIPPDHADHIA